ncbi:response regulator [Parvibaculum sedimenti]|uniref:Response regulator n=1 Tax=Parvibaculum sedimenti TaxID=2608632 RepID=A0A6N6VP95_9HYPH|nr:response regulator [Parvibaculum sedimenti]KAB7740704.1 response regulator [Parvibaculum sedimenti]
MSITGAHTGRLSREFAIKFLIVSFLLTGVQIALDYRDGMDRLRDRVSLRATAVTDGFSLIAETNPSFTLNHTRQWLDRKARALPDLLGLYVVDPQGHAISDTGRGANEGALLNEPPVRAALSRSFDEQTVLGFELSHRGKPLWIRVAPLPRIGSVMVAAIDFDSVRGEMSQTLWHSALRRFAALILLLGAIYALVRHGVVRPITELARAIGSSRPGERFEAPADIPENEIGALARVFDDTWSKLGENLRTNKMLALVANSTQAGMLIADATGRIAWCNAGFVALTGFDRQDVEGRMPDEVLAGRTWPVGAVRALSESRRRGELRNIEMRNQTRSGRAYWASIEARPVRGDNGKIEHFIVVETDITHVKDAKYALRKSEIELAARVTELQETQVELERERAKLAQATLELAQSRRDAERRLAAPFPSAPAQAELQQSEKTGTPLDVLLAEDQAVNQKLVSAVMERLGHRLTIANNGAEAVRALRAARFDLVLMDIQMPEVDGILATQIIRAADEPWRTVPIIALTAHATEGHRQNYLTAGMDGFVAKPFKIDILVAEMARVMPTAQVKATMVPEAASTNDNKDKTDQAALLENALDDLEGLFD